MDAIADAFKTLRADGLAAPDRWQPIYRSGLVAAFEARRFDEAAALAVFAANALDSQGRFQAAIDELDFALSHEPSSPDAAADLLATKAVFLALRGVHDAEGTMESARSLRAADRSCISMVPVCVSARTAREPIPAPHATGAEARLP